MPKPQAILFDLFFTLIDPLQDQLRESEYAVLKVERGEFEEWNGIDYAVRADGTIRGVYDVFRHIVRGKNIDEALLIRAAEARLERIRGALCGVEAKKTALLHKLREMGIKLCLVSNADEMDKYHWQSSPLSACFDQAIFSCDVGLLKPDPRIYRLALERLGLDPSGAEFASRCFYAGDGGHDELRGAKEAGLTTILTTEYITRVWPEKIPCLRKDADYEVPELEDILAIINETYP